jgi:hypothetical protein
MNIGRLGATQNFPGNISALYIFNKALTNADRIRFEALVSQKWQVANLSYPQGIAGVPGVQLYIDFSDASTLYDATSGGSLVAPDGAIARAEDKSGNNFHATQSTSGNRFQRKINILNGRDIARGVDDFMLFPAIPAMKTIISVSDVVKKSNFQRIVFAPQSNINTLIYAGDVIGRIADAYAMRGFIRSGAVTKVSEITSLSSGFKILAVALRESDELEILQNGIVESQSLSNSNFTTSATNFILGATANGLGGSATHPIQGDMATVIVTDKTLPPMHLNYIMEILGGEFDLEAPFITERKNLVISYPNVAKNSAMIATNQTWKTLKNHWNLYRGNRYHYAELESANSNPREWVFTLNTPQTVDHIVLARADMLLATGDTNIKLEFSNNGTLWQESWSDVITSDKLTGIRNQDFIVNTYNFGSRSHWRFTITGGTGVTQFSKLYLGKAFDFGVNTSSINDRLFFPNQQKFLGTSGSAYLQQVDAGRNVVNLTFDGVSDADADRFISEIISMQNTHQGVFLWNPNETRLLNQNILLHCRIVNWSKKDVLGFPNWNQITIELEELLG